MIRSAHDLATAAVVGLVLGVAGQFAAVSARVAGGELDAGPGAGAFVFGGVLLVWAAATIWRLRGGAGLVLGGLLALSCVGLYVALPVTLAGVGTKAMHLTGPEYAARAVIAASGIAFAAAAWMRIARRPRTA